MGEMVGRFKPGENLPVFANEEIPEARVVMLAGGKTTQGAYKGKLGTANIEPSEVVGVSQRGSGPTTDPAASWTRQIEVQTGGVAWIKAAEVINAGEKVYVSGSGEIKKWESGKNSIGLCMATCESGKPCEVKLSVA